MKTIWFDITNVPHVNFFKPLINHLDKKYNLIFTIKDFAETEKLFVKEIGKEYQVVGAHMGGNKIAKIMGMINRALVLTSKVPKFDIKISIGGDSSNICAKIRGKKTITFDDNEQAPNWRYSFLSDYAFWPKAVSIDILQKQMFKERKLYQYNGLKEDFYIESYIPNRSFLDLIPFDNYIVLRPENIKANYVSGKKTIIPELVEKLVKKSINIVYLPRYASDFSLVQESKNIYIPKSPLNGLDLCFFSLAVLTGAGTFAREAACLGKPAFSFYTGKELLAVDRYLVDKGLVKFSRDVDYIVGEVDSIYHNHRKGSEDKFNKHSVQEEIFSKIDELIKQWGK